VRELGVRYDACIREDSASRIDVPRARAQHADYVAALRALGLQVETLPADDACPDACFVEDTAVLADRHALATRPGAPSRRAEVAAVASALARDHVVTSLDAPATLDGGDVLRVGDRLFAGLSARTNDAGLAALAAVAERAGLRVVPLRVRAGLHLKSACTLAAPGVLVYDPDTLDADALAAFRAAGLACHAALEFWGANTLALGDVTLVSAAAPRTAAMLAREGLATRVLDVGEFHKGDGALTCLSLRVAREGCWCT
jgi:dimethylargininase